jgi:hypothetical protein
MSRASIIADALKDFALSGIPLVVYHDEISADEFTGDAWGYCPETHLGMFARFRDESKDIVISSMEIPIDDLDHLHLVTNQWLESGRNSLYGCVVSLRGESSIVGELEIMPLEGQGVECKSESVTDAHLMPIKGIKFTGALLGAIDACKPDTACERTPLNDPANLHLVVNERDGFDLNPLFGSVVNLAGLGRTSSEYEISPLKGQGTESDTVYYGKESDLMPIKGIKISEAWSSVLDRL